MAMGAWGGRLKNEDGDDNNDDNDNDNDNDNENDKEVYKQHPLALSVSANYIILSPGLLLPILSKIIRSYYVSNFFF